MIVSTTSYEQFQVTSFVKDPANEPRKALKSMNFYYHKAMPKSQHWTFYGVSFTYVLNSMIKDASISSTCKNNFYNFP